MNVKATFLTIENYDFLEDLRRRFFFRACWCTSARRVRHGGHPQNTVPTFGVFFFWETFGSSLQSVVVRTSPTQTVPLSCVCPYQLIRFIQASTKKSGDHRYQTQIKLPLFRDCRFPPQRFLIAP